MYCTRGIPAVVSQPLLESTTSKKILKNQSGFRGEPQKCKEGFPVLEAMRGLATEFKNLELNLLSLIKKKVT